MTRFDSEKELHRRRYRCQMVIIMFFMVSCTVLYVIKDYRVGWNEVTMPLFATTRQNSTADFRTSEPLGPRYLLLAYFRSGSTFASELLSLSPTVNYLFEPLYIFREAKIDWNVEREGSSVAKLLENLYHCDSLLLSYVLRFTFVRRIQFVEKYCLSRPMLIKTIRVHGKVVPKLLDVMPNLKVIHLIRDPRAVLASQMLLKMNVSENSLCRTMRIDLQTMDMLQRQYGQLWRERYKVVRYEDLANQSQITNTVISLYNFMEIPFDNALLDRYKHKHYTDAVTEKNFKTVRTKNHDYSQWRHLLSTNDTTAINQHCADILERFGYEVVN